jgi:branched-chain amino acid transport system permease protein
MVVFGGLGHIPGVILGALVLTALPEVLRYIVGPLQTMTDGRLDAGMLRPLLIALAMIATMLLRPRGLWPAPERASGLGANALTPTASGAPTRWRSSPCAATPAESRSSPCGP